MRTHSGRDPESSSKASRKAGFRVLPAGSCWQPRNDKIPWLRRPVAQLRNGDSQACRRFPRSGQPRIKPSPPSLLGREDWVRGCSGNSRYASPFADTPSPQPPTMQPLAEGASKRGRCALRPRSACRQWRHPNHASVAIHGRTGIIHSTANRGTPPAPITLVVIPGPFPVASETEPGIHFEPSVGSPRMEKGAGFRVLPVHSAGSPGMTKGRNAESR